MDVTELTHELRRRGIELRLNADRTRLGVAAGHKDRLTPQITAAIKEDYHYLIRAELLRAAAHDFHERLTTQAGLSRSEPEYEAAYATLGEGFPDDFLAEAWEKPLEDFRDALKEYFAPGYAALEDTLDRESLAHSDEPALFSDSVDAPAHLPPAAGH